MILPPTVSTVPKLIIMAIVLLFLGCFVLYGKSKYFPEHLASVGKRIKDNRKMANLLGYFLLTASLLMFGWQFGWATGFIIFFTTLSLGYCLLLIVLPLHKNYVYAMTAICVCLIIIDQIL
ncbi:MAG: hypothetical protein AAFX53_00025 [Bacteroidota bacterium]